LKLIQEYKDMTSSNPINSYSGISTSGERKDEECPPVVVNEAIQSLWAEWRAAPPEAPTNLRVVEKRPLAEVVLTPAELKKRAKAEKKRIYNKTYNVKHGPREKERRREKKMLIPNEYHEKAFRARFYKEYGRLESSCNPVAPPFRGLSEDNKEPVDSFASIQDIQDIWAPAPDSSEKAVDYHSGATSAQSISPTPVNPQDTEGSSRETDLPVQLDDSVWKEWIRTVSNSK
jgi:hypothetical protein